MLHVTALSKTFGSHTVIDNVDLHVKEGEFVALLGPSGTGKTTLLRIVAGFEDADAGEVRIGNRIVVKDHFSASPERRQIGMVFQDYALFPHLSVRDNVAFGLPRGSERQPRVETVLDAVDLRPWIDAMPYVLSGGQQQRVALARALAPNPGIVLLDEPFSNLDPALREHVRADVRRVLQSEGVTAVLVTHDQEEALSIADRVAVMFDGHIAQFDRPEVVYHEPATREVARFIGDAQFLRGAVDDGTVNTAIGRLDLATPEIHHQNDTVDALVRPEMIALTPAQEIGEASLTAVITSKRFHGRDQRIEVTLPDDVNLRVTAPSHLRFNEGDRVMLTVTRPVVTFAPHHLEEPSGPART